MSATVHEGIVQGTKEWNRLRAGIPTASQAHRIITPGLKACKDSTHDTYLFELLAERIQSEPKTEKPQTFWWAERGKELEQDAVLSYEMINQVETYPVSFVVAANKRWGASPDRGVDPNGMLEFKCENDADHISYVLQEGALYEAHKLQVQFQLLVWEDREWNDLIAFNPKLPRAIHRSYRQDNIQKLLKDTLEKFCDRLDALWETCVSRGYADEISLARFPLRTLAPTAQ